MADPKKSFKPFRANAEAWELMRLSFKDEKCWVCGERWEDLHHVLARDGNGTWPSGDDVLGNLTPVCRGCHGDIEERRGDARTKLRSALMPSNLNYLVFKLGGAQYAEAFLDRHYPRTQETSLL